MLRLSSICAFTETTCRRNFCIKSSTRRNENYYEILNLRRNCSQRDIREAFVKLSKMYHPDVKGQSPSDERAARFVQISEAYKTLIKPKDRQNYDYSIELRSGSSARTPFSDATSPRENIYHSWEIKPDYNPNPGPYYGFKGLGKVSNMQVAIVLAAVGIVCALLGFATIRYSFALNRRKLDEISAEANTHHENVTSDAKKYGNEEQLRRMLERMRKEGT